VSFHKKRIYLLLFISCLFIPSFQSFAQQKVSTDGIVKDPAWSKPYKPFRIAGNLYYVGTYDLACYLIKTKKGLILINTGLKETVSTIVSNVESLGFEFSNVKILLTSQARFDHVGGMDIIKKFTGARLMVDSADAQVMADGGKSDYLYGGAVSLFDPVQPDKLLHDKDVIKLGKMRITVLHTPGPTMGACSYLFDVKAKKHRYKVLIANMPVVPPEVNFANTKKYPDIIKDFGYSYKEMRQLKFDLWFAAHASQFGLHEKREEGNSYNPDAFADKPGYDKLLNDLQDEYIKKLNML